MIDRETEEQALCQHQRCGTEETAPKGGLVLYRES